MAINEEVSPMAMDDPALPSLGSPDRDTADHCGRLRDLISVFLHYLDMQLNRLTNILLGFLESVSQGNAARQVRHVCRPISRSVLVNDCKFLHGSAILNIA